MCSIDAEPHAEFSRRPSSSFAFAYIKIVYLKFIFLCLIYLHFFCSLIRGSNNIKFKKTKKQSKNTRCPFAVYTRVIQFICLRPKSSENPEKNTRRRNEAKSGISWTFWEGRELKKNIKKKLNVHKRVSDFSYNHFFYSLPLPLPLQQQQLFIAMP